MTDTKPNQIVAIVVAGGVGKRMGAEMPKQFLDLAGEPILFHSLRAFDSHPEVDSLCVVVDAAHHGMMTSEEPWTALKKPLILANSGSERADSVRNGLVAVKGIASIVLIHDAARPLVTAEMIDDTLAQARQGNGGIVARPISDTVKEAGELGMITQTRDRNGLWMAETPQTFPFDLIWRAHELVTEQGLTITDDAQAVELMQRPVALCPAKSPNLKITQPDDLIVAEAILRARDGVRAR